MKYFRLIIIILLAILLASTVAFGTSVPLGPYFDDAYFDLSNSALILKVVSHEKGGLEADVSTYDGLVKISGGSTSAIKVKLDATSAPTVNDDVDLGYAVGSRWVDVTNDKEYVCLDNADGSAVWTETTGAGGGASTYLELTDTPAAYDTGKYAKSTADGVVWDTPDGGGNVSTSGTPVQYDYARFTDATTIEGREYSEVKTDLAYQLSDMSDVGSTTATDTYVLVADGDSWESRALVEADISDLGAYLTSESDPVFIAHDAYAVTSAKITNWDTAYGWGDHSIVGYLENITGESIGDLSNVDLTNLADNKILKYNSVTSKFECEDDTGGGATTFTGLTDTPSSYTGQAGLYAKVNAGETALEFGTPAGGGTVTTSGTPVANDIARFTGATVIEGLSYAEFKAALDLEIGTDIQAYSVDNAFRTDKLSVFAATTEAELYTVLSDVTLFLEDLVDDTTPDLGGELDAGAHSIGFTLQSTTGDGTTTIDWTLGNKFKFTFGAQNDTFTFTPPTNPCTLMLTIIQDGTGSRTITWPATVKWPGGTAPTLSTAANARDKIALDWDGTQYDGVCSKDFK